MLSVSSDIFRYKLSTYLSETDVLALSSTCTQILACYPLEYRAKLVQKSRIGHLRANYGVMRYNLVEKRMIGIDWTKVPRITWNAFLDVIVAEYDNGVVCISYLGRNIPLIHFALHVMSYAIYQDVYIIDNDITDWRSTVLGVYSRNVNYYWPLMITSDRYDPSRITFNSLTTDKEYIVHFCTKKRLQKRRKLSGYILVLDLE